MMLVQLISLNLIFVPLATIRLHHNVGPIVVSTMLADYLNISLGVEF